MSKSDRPAGVAVDRSVRGRRKLCGRYSEVTDGPDLSIREPMLAHKVRLDQLTFPKLASPKLDGIRAFAEERLWSRKLKEIPNAHAQALFSRFTGFDGELIVGPPNAPDVYNRTESGVMSRDGSPPMAYYVFDDITARDYGFYDRLRLVADRVKAYRATGAGGDYPVRYVRHVLVRDLTELFAFEDKVLSLGYEGVMLRDPNGPYKEGRSTVKEGWLLKLKRLEDAEAVIIGVKPKLHNANPAEINELGRTKRSSHKANKVVLDEFGGFELRLPSGVEFNAPMGKGWTDEKKAQLWAHRKDLIGKWVVFESLPIGVKDRPRQPKVKGFRDIYIDG